MTNRLARGLIAMVVAVSTVAILQFYPSLLTVENPIIGAGNSLNVPTPKVGLTVGQIAPNFTLTTLDGEKIQLIGLKGKVVVLDFMATWCIPC